MNQELLEALMDWVRAEIAYRVAAAVSDSSCSEADMAREAERRLILLSAKEQTR